MEYVEDYLTVSTDPEGAPDLPDADAVEVALASMKAKPIEGEEWESVSAGVWRMKMLRPDPWTLS